MINIYETYIPKLYKRELIDINKNGLHSVFEFKDKNDSGRYLIPVDESIERIIVRMKDVKNGERDKVYLTAFMRNIDIEYVGNNLWMLFDEFDFYQFEYVV